MSDPLLEALEQDALEQDLETRTAAPSQDVMFLGAQLEKLKSEIDALDAQGKSKRAEFDHIRKVQLPDAMRAAKMVRNDKGSFTLASGAKISLRTDLHVGVKSDDREPLHAWLRERGDASLITQTVHPQTLKAHCRELLRAGVQLPRFITQFNETSATITRGRKGEESEE